MNLTFKQYLKSKEVLREAIERTPEQEISYSITKYVNLPVLFEGERLDVSLRPKQKMKVKWRYEDIYNPVPLEVFFENLNNVNEQQGFQVVWKPSKIRSWILKNTREDK